MKIGLQVPNFTWAGGPAQIPGSVQHAIFNIPTVHEIRPLEVFARDIIPAVAGF